MDSVTADVEALPNWSTAVRANTAWKASPTAAVRYDDVTVAQTKLTTNEESSTKPSSPHKNQTKAKSIHTSTDFSDVHFKPKHPLNKSVFHQEAPHNHHLNTDALEHFIKGDPIEPIQYEKSRGKHSSIRPSTSSLPHPSRTSKHSHILSNGSASTSYVDNGSSSEKANHQGSVTSVTETQESRLQREEDELGHGYTSSIQKVNDADENAVTEATGTQHDKSSVRVEQSFKGENSLQKERLNKLKSQVHSATQDDDGEYEYEEESLYTDDYDGVDNTEEVTQDNGAEEQVHIDTTAETDGSKDDNNLKTEELSDAQEDSQRENLPPGE